MGKSKTPEERAAKKERKLAKLLKQSNTGEVAKDAEATFTQGSKGSELELAMEVDETVGEKLKKDKKSSKKRRLEEDAAQVDVSAIAEGSDAPKKKKRKEKKRDVEELPAESNSMNVDAMEAASAEESKPSEKKKVKEGKKENREKRKKEGELPPAPTETGVNNQASPSDAIPEQPSESLNKEDKKKVKRQKKAQANDEDALASPKKKKNSKSKDGSSSAPAPSSHSKPRKNRTEFPDPFADESLSEQARKALDYAFVQFNDPSEWKFNKAKQNWLIRNVWSSEAIPDSYLPLAMKYLTQVQGGSREKLKETCKAALSETVPPPPAVATEEADKPKSSEPIKGASEEPEKPKSILKPTKPVAGAIIAAAAPEPPKAPTANIKKERAQILLEALAEDTS